MDTQSRLFTEKIDLLTSFDATCEIAGEVICMFHDLEEVSNEKLQIRACVPDLSGLADEFAERFPELDFPEGYGNRQILVQFNTDADPDAIYSKALSLITSIVEKCSRNTTAPICFDTTFYE